MKFQDVDGDIWESDGEGGWELNPLSPSYDCSYFPDRETLEIVWGPLSEEENE